MNKWILVEYLPNPHESPPGIKRSSDRLIWKSSKFIYELLRKDIQLDELNDMDK